MITHFSRSQAEAMEGDNSAVIISIFGSTDTPATLQPGWHDVLRLQFDDVSEKAEFGIPFNDSMADEVIAFIEKNPGKHVFIHCAAGRSRSAGMAVGVAHFFGREGELEIHAGAIPNALVTRLFHRRLWL